MKRIQISSLVSAVVGLSIGTLATASSWLPAVDTMLSATRAPSLRPQTLLQQIEATQQTLQQLERRISESAGEPRPDLYVGDAADASAAVLLKISALEARMDDLIIPAEPIDHPAAPVEDPSRRLLAERDSAAEAAAELQESLAVMAEQLASAPADASTQARIEGTLFDLPEPDALGQSQVLGLQCAANYCRVDVSHTTELDKQQFVDNISLFLPNGARSRLRAGADPLNSELWVELPQPEIDS